MRVAMQRFPYLKNWFLMLVSGWGIFIRLFLLGAIPPGLNQDEASIGYDAWSLLHYGVDRNGFHNPVHFVSWGSGQNSLHAYFSMPFIAIFGLTPLSVRLVNALLGCISLFIFYDVISRISGKDKAIIATFLLSISPWHIMMSRWELESNNLSCLYTSRGTASRNCPSKRASVTFIFFFLCSFLVCLWDELLLCTSLSAFGFFLPPKIPED
ncbi:MAG: glycosyltransferase family 39 protein [Candidatus Caldatribacteriaceae bacterium]